mgnify:CR=1 FL=1
MKRFFQYMLAAVAAVATVACSQEFDEPGILPEEDGGVLAPMTINVGSEGTRANIDGNVIKWTANDKLAIYEGTSSYSDAGKVKNEFTISSIKEDGASASFTGTATESQTKFYVMYPFESTDSRSSGTAFYMILPNEQKLGDNNVADNAILSIGYFERESATDVVSATLQNVVGFLRVQITFDDVEEVIVSGNNIAGKVKVTGKTAVADTANITQASSTVTLLPKDEVFEPGVYYVALLPSTTPAGEFRVTFNRTSQTLTAYTSTKDVTIERNKGVSISDYKWEKGACIIKNADDLSNFLANSSKYGEAEFANNINLEGVTLPTAGVFEGVLDAKGYKLMNWNATAPLFDNLVGSVKNLVIDESCYLTPADEVGPFGFVAATVASGGSLENITNNSQEISLVAENYGSGSSQTDDAIYFGVLAGECYGTVVNCVNNANITIVTAPTSTEKIRGMVYIGGLVGLIDNADMIAANPDLVSMSNCQNYGNISYTVSEGRGGFLFMGGIAGGTTASKLSTSTPVKAHIDNCLNMGSLSNIYPDSATDIGKLNTNNSNYTYIAGIIGYCEGSVSNSVNGELYNMTNGAITHTTPTLTAGFVVAKSTVAGVAGFAMTAGTKNTNYAPIVVEGSFGPGTVGTSQLGGGAQNGVSVAGVVGQTGAGTYFKSYTLSDCNNYGTVDVNFAMSENTSTNLYVGGVTGYASTPVDDLNNYAKVSVVSSAINHSVGGVLGQGYYGLSNAVNNANVEVELVSNGGNQIDGANNCIGGVIGMTPGTSGASIANLTNNNPVSVEVTGSEVVPGEVYVGGVAGKTNMKAASLINNETTTFVAGGVTEAYVGGLCGYGTGELMNSINTKAVTATATSATAEFAVGGLLASSGITVMEKSDNNGAVSVTLSGSAVKAYAGGLIGYAGGKITATDCNNTATVIFSAPEAEITELSVAGISGRSYTKSIYTRCQNSADITVSAKSATAAHLAGIEGAPNSAAISSTNAATTSGCVNTGNLYADFSATWYVGGISSWGGTWSSTASSQMKATDNVVECDITINSTTKGHYVGGIVGFSGLHTEVSGNSYEGTITAGNNTSETIRGFVGGIVGVEAVNQTSASSQKNGVFNFSANKSKAVIDCGTGSYAGMLLGGVDNVSTKDGSYFTKKSELTVNYDTESTNKVLSGSELNGAAVTVDNYISLVMGAYSDAERFSLVENGRNSVVFE